MNSLETLSTLAQRVDTARQSLAKQEARLDHLRASRQEAADKLKSLGFDSVDAANARVTEIETYVESNSTKIENLLSQINERN